MQLSVISPVYQAEDIVDELVIRISKAVSQITEDYEIILVDDCSTDNSWIKIKENCDKDKRVKGVKLSNNFGQQYSMTAGLEISKGDYVVVIDCDLQDEPSYIPMLYEKTKEGFDIVYTRAKTRTHSFLRNLYSSLFKIVLNWFSDCNYIGQNVTCFSVLSRKVVNAFCRIKDSQRHYLLLLRWLGFKYCYVDVIQNPRFSGSSSYSFLKLWEHAIDGIVSQSDKLLRLSISLGLSLSFLSMFFSVLLVVMYFIKGFKEGWTSLMVLILFTTGAILISIGILGIYLGKALEQAKGRPLYIIDEKVNI
ncbi:MAG: hypothetical protein A3B68_04325 [Candidatus Melainabacteria bacterium RIFCSPHIGHO2_02_FULL_34_12]|nr:MAG: hypothetical protein A3B68_04325 [Candidatus Melainabacteria bacterium RIFCSPHIGHO2_02_FULL_34_12]